MALPIAHISPCDPVDGLKFGHPAAARLVAGLCLALTLAACTTTAPQVPRTPTTVPTTEALLFPPPGGPGLLGVVETRYVNAVSQTITLQTDTRTPGENAITVTRFTGAGGTGDFGELADVELAQVDLLGEAQIAWPQAQMQVSPYFAQNTYGPFGYAVGPTPTGDICIYAWQRVEPRLRPGGGVERGSVSVRLRACDRAANEQRLVGLMYAMRLRDPVFDNIRASALIGQPGLPIIPQGVEGFAQVIVDPPVNPVVTQPAPVTTTPVATQPAPVTPAIPVPTGPIVPLPGGVLPATPAPAPGGSPPATGPTVPLPPEA